MMADRPAPFEVKDCAMITLALGKSAHNLRELRDRVVEAPPQSIYHHFYETLLRPGFDDPEYRNDFALWARRQLHDFHLAERLGIIEPMDYPDMEALRQHLVEIIEDRLMESLPQAAVHPGREFHFLRSRLVVFDAGISADSPESLARIMPRISSGSVFYHVIEARRRSPQRADDFSTWLGLWGPRYAAPCRALSEIDSSLWPLTELRDLLAGCFAVPTDPEIMGTS